MKKEKRVIQVIIKSGLITWVLLLLIWQTGSLFYSDDFLPGPNALLHLHLQPIYHIVYVESYYLTVWDILSWGGLHT